MFKIENYKVYFNNTEIILPNNIDIVKDKNDIIIYYKSEYTGIIPIHGILYNNQIVFRHNYYISSNNMKLSIYVSFHKKYIDMDLYISMQKNNIYLKKSGLYKIEKL